jgi:hypothetical protein
MSEQNELPPEAVMMQMISGKFVTVMLYVVAELKIADLVAEGPRSVADLAKETGANERSIYRILRALSSIGTFTETEDGVFGSTPTSDVLRSGVPGSMREMAIWIGCPFHNTAWSDIMPGVMSGGSNFSQRFGINVFEHMNENPKDLAIFQNAMTGFSGISAQWVVDAYDFSGASKVVDVGGGNGLLVSKILAANPSLQGILYDLPQVVAGAPDVLNAEGVADRCETIGGSFFEGVPKGADAYVLKHIIHDWDDERNKIVLDHCREAMNDGGKVVVVDMVIPPGNDPFFGKLLDIEMLVVTEGGLERKEEEHRALFESAGLNLDRVIPTEGFICVLEGSAK